MFSIASNFPAMDSDETLVMSSSDEEKDVYDFTSSPTASIDAQKKKASRHWYSVAKQASTQSTLSETEKSQARSSLAAAGFSTSQLLQDRNQAILWAAETANTIALAYCLELPTERAASRKFGIAVSNVNRKPSRSSRSSSPSSHESISPLHVAAANGNNSAVKLLLAHGVPLDSSKAYGTPLHLAAERGHDSVVRTLLNAGADVNALTPVKQQSALQLAAESERESTVRLLLTRGANPNLGRRRRSLHAAAEYDNVVAVNLLLDAGADLNAVDDNGRTPLHLAARSGHGNVAFMLVTRGAAVSVGDVRGMTALDHAVQGQRPDVARFLTKSGAEPARRREIRMARPVAVQRRAVAVL